MKIFRIVFAVLFLAFAILTTAHSIEPPKGVQFSKKEKKSFALINEIKEFEKTVGLKETENFKIFRDAEYLYTSLRCQKRTEPAFSYIDPKMTVIRDSDFKTAEDAVDFFKNGYKEQFDSDQYQCDILRGVSANGTIVNRRLLSWSPWALVTVVIHEDFHDNSHLPHHIEEAAADLVSYAIAFNYGFDFKSGDGNGVHCYLAEQLKEARVINGLHSEIMGLSRLRAGDKITESYYLLEKDRIIGEAKKHLGWSNDTSEIYLTNYHSYTYYFPLMYELFYALGADINHFIEFLRKMPFKAPEFTTRPEYFGKTRMIEKEIEDFIRLTLEKMGSSSPF